MNYTHLSREERYQIHALRRRKVCIAAIAADLDRHRSTIARELERNASAKGQGSHYHPVQAHVQAKARLSGPSNVRTIASEDWALVGLCGAAPALPKTAQKALRQRPGAPGQLEELPAHQ